MWEILEFLFEWLLFDLEYFILFSLILISNLILFVFDITGEFISLIKFLIINFLFSFWFKLLIGEKFTIFSLLFLKAGDFVFWVFWLGDFFTVFSIIESNLLFFLYEFWLVVFFIVSVWVEFFDWILFSILLLEIEEFEFELKLLIKLPLKESFNW